ncbi:ACT domain-containing protein [Pseudoflavonifractor sp. 524-17]|uniref:ACT domain-containing protein n=1 Tax=Pseudoflavonifractor sp. 524-17 TaxID=2304577 RepID=UPI001379E4C2|nr:ACT domain-containing protein [Pseudoflavonifractor sp. 524-17]NCE63460.1 ACT domain-containing protein [Pseudoflavonifractor sp. 524-17]
MRAIVTVLGKDDIGILSFITALLAEQKVSVLDISQTIMREYFTMVMLVDCAKIEQPFDALAAYAQAEGEKRSLSVHIQREDLFHAMHRI